MSTTARRYRESRERGRVERCLSQADRRLAQAVRALAFLQDRTRPPPPARRPLACATVPPGGADSPGG